MWKVADEPVYPADEHLSSEEKERIYRENIEQFEQDMKEKAEKGEARQSGDKKLKIGVWIKPAQVRQHDVPVWINGNMHTIRFHTNPAIPRAINGANIVNAERHRAFVNKSIGAIGGLTRFMSTMYTTFRPAFVLFTNPVRDFHHMTNTLFIKEGVGYAIKTMGNYPIAWATIPVYLAGKGNIKNKYMRYWAEYIAHGAKTGISHLLELKDIQKDIERELKSMDKSAIGKLPSMTGAFLKSAFENINEWTENTTRFAVYITSREMGRSVVQSVSDAKNVTVNFNQKGSGAMGNSELRKLWAFTNAGIQGAANLIENAGKHPVRFITATATGIAISAFFMPFVNTFLGALFGGGDDDGEKSIGEKMSDFGNDLENLITGKKKPEWMEEYSRLSSYRRNSTWSFWTGKGFVHVPLSQEYRMFNGLGNDFFMWRAGYSDGVDLAKNMIESSLNLIAYNPVLDAYQGSWADALPTAFIPPVQLATNKDFMGRPIYKEEYIKEGIPMYKQVRTNREGKPYTPAPTIKAIELLNKIGGDEFTPGWISKAKLGKIDLGNPDVINHVLNAYIPAFYNPIVRQMDNFASDKSFAEKAQGLFVPGSMYTSVDNLPAESASFYEKYKKAAKEMEVMDNRYKEILKKYDENPEYYENYLAKHPEIQLGAAYYTGINKIATMQRELNKAIKEGLDDEIRKLREDEIVIAKKNLMEAYKKQTDELKKK